MYDKYPHSYDLGKKSIVERGRDSEMRITKN